VSEEYSRPDKRSRQADALKDAATPREDVKLLTHPPL